MSVYGQLNLTNVAEIAALLAAGIGGFQCRSALQANQSVGILTDQQKCSLITALVIMLLGITIHFVTILHRQFTLDVLGTVTRRGVDVRSQGTGISLHTIARITKQRITDGARSPGGTTLSQCAEGLINCCTTVCRAVSNNLAFAIDIAHSRENTGAGGQLQHTALFNLQIAVGARLGFRVICGCIEQRTVSVQDATHGDGTVIDNSGSAGNCQLQILAFRQSCGLLNIIVVVAPAGSVGIGEFRATAIHIVFSRFVGQHQGHTTGNLNSAIGGTVYFTAGSKYNLLVAAILCRTNCLIQEAVCSRAYRISRSIRRNKITGNGSVIGNFICKLRIVTNNRRLSIAVSKDPAVKQITAICCRTQCKRGRCGGASHCDGISVFVLYSVAAALLGGFKLDRFGQLLIVKAFNGKITSFACLRRCLSVFARLDSNLKLATGLHGNDIIRNGTLIIRCREGTVVNGITQCYLAAMNIFKGQDTFLAVPF